MKNCKENECCREIKKGHTYNRIGYRFSFFPRVLKCAEEKKSSKKYKFGKR